MLNDEEKKAIELVKKDIEVYKQKGLWKENSILVKSLRTILNLIEKQSKEIEELKRKKATYYYEWKHLEANVINKIQEYDDKGMTVNLVNRSTGKTFQQAVHYEVIKVLQSLLEKE